MRAACLVLLLTLASTLAVAQEPRVDEPSVDEPRVDEPRVDGPRVDEPGIDRPRAQRSGPPALDPAVVEQRLRDYVRVWEADERVGPNAMNAYYADRVIYYGKAMSRREVLADKLRFIRAYPERSYDIAPDTLRTRCTPARCEARAVLLWKRTNARGRTEQGASALTLVFSAANQGRIVRELATTLRRR